MQSVEALLREREAVNEGAALKRARINADLKVARKLDKLEQRKRRNHLLIRLGTILEEYAESSLGLMSEEEFNLLFERMERMLAYGDVVVHHLGYADDPERLAAVLFPESSDREKKKDKQVDLE